MFSCAKTRKLSRGPFKSKLLRLWLCLLLPLLGFAETNSFRFAWLSDTHIGSSNATENLRASVQDINSTPGLSFVIVSGDITEYGSRRQLRSAKHTLDELLIPYHIIPGNHDTKWSESGGSDFRTLWPDDRFEFEFGSYRFIGMHEGPLMKMGDGHWAPQDLRWLQQTLEGMTDTNQPVVFVTHYPVDQSIDNWYSALDLLKTRNTQVILCGHGHANKAFAFEGIPGVMGRSNLETKKVAAGYNVVEVQTGKMTFSERLPGLAPKQPWHSVTLRDHRTDSATNWTVRPDFSINARYPTASQKWVFDTGFTIASSPARWRNCAIAADVSGAVHGLSIQTGKPIWTFQANGGIVSTPATAKGRVVFAGTEGAIYALDATTGKRIWRFPTTRPIVASPAINQGRVYIGSSEGIFRALDLGTGKVDWEFDAVGGFVETKPLVYRGKVIFGGWDEHLYAVDARTGRLCWKWRGDRRGVLFSPAACWPVGAKGTIFIVAPDREMTALAAGAGTQIWRTGDYGVRESIGLSEDSSRFYVRAMNDFFHAFSTSGATPTTLWSSNAHFGYDINSGMLVEKEGVVFYGTKNGLIFALDANTGAIRWQHKFGVGLVNTVLPVSGRQVLVTDVDGRIGLVEEYGT